MATKSRPFSIRVQPHTLERLEERAGLDQENKSRLVERYLEEGLAMEDHPRIHFVPGPSGRRPAILGTGLGVSEVVETVKTNENSIKEAAEYLEIPEPLVLAAWQYYAEYPDEVDRWIERKHRLADREEQRWRRAQAALP